ncbi:MAG: hypothetical protein Q8K67_11205 [Geothrix sp.]|nr:hypothetical protein [Geothrix sp.]
MIREEAEFILAPIILGFEVAKDRVTELLRQSQPKTGMNRAAYHELVRHESDLEQALAYLMAREKAWAVDGLMQAVDTGRTVATWPSVMPGSDYPSRIIAAWRDSKSETKAAPNVAPLARPA